MRGATTWLVVVGVILAAAGTASAQGRRGGGPMMLGNPAVQEELKLTAEQKDKVQKFMEDFQPKMQERMQSVFQNAGGDFEKMTEEMQKINADALKEVTPLLKPEQLARFKQILLQQTGAQAFVSNPELQAALKLTNDQKDKFKKLTAEQREKTMELVQGGFGPDTQQKMQALQKDYAKKAEEMLTADQRKTYQDLLGKPFEMPAQGRRGGGGR